MNSYNTTGRLVRDPELRSLPDGTPVCTIRLAVEGMKPGRGTGYIDVDQFGAGGEAIANTISQGWLVAVSGRLQMDEWDAKDGSGKRHDYRVVGHVEFLAAPRSQQPDANGAEPVAARTPDGDDIPF